MQGTKKKPRAVLRETIRTTLLAITIVAVGIWTQLSKKPRDPAPGPVIFSMPTVAVELADPPDNDAAPDVPDLSPAAPETTPDTGNA